MFVKKDLLGNLNKEKKDTSSTLHFLEVLLGRNQGRVTRCRRKGSWGNVMVSQWNSDRRCAKSVGGNEVGKKGRSRREGPK